MRTRPAPASPLYPKLRFAFTDHPITVWAGAILLRLYFELIGLRAALMPLLVSFTKTSNNQIAAVDVLLAWWYGLALGAERFEHLVSTKEVLHHGNTGAGQIAKIWVWKSKDRGSARIVPFLRSTARTVEGAPSPHRARTGDTEVHHESHDLCRDRCLARHG